MRRFYSATWVACLMGISVSLHAQETPRQTPTENPGQTPSASPSTAAEKKADGKREKGGGGPPGRGARGPVPVRASKVELKVLPESVTLVASLSGRQQVDVYSRVAGRVAAFGPQEGEPIKAGQVVLRVDRSEPGESFLSVPILSPISGWVGRWNVKSIGEAVNLQEPVASIVDDSALRATVNLPAVDWLDVQKSTVVRVNVGAVEKPAKVIAVSRSADSDSGRGSVVVEVDNADLKLRAGLVAKVTLELDPKTRLIIPTSALFVTERGAHVFTLDMTDPASPKANRVTVQYRLVSTELVEITSGLSDGDMLVTLGGNLLGPGAQVKLMGES